MRLNEDQADDVLQQLHVLVLLDVLWRRRGAGMGRIGMLSLVRGAMNGDRL